MSEHANTTPSVRRTLLLPVLPVLPLTPLLDYIPSGTPVELPVPDFAFDTDDFAMNCKIARFIRAVRAIRVVGFIRVIRVI